MNDWKPASNSYEKLQQIKEYYGRYLASKADLQTSACCPTDSLPHYLKNILKLIEPEIQEKFYGCGSPIPLALEGRTVLDLGCGSGRDVYLASRLVGVNGDVIGVDMTEEQLAIAQKHLPTHMERFGYDRYNVDFRLGIIEDLNEVGIANESIDVVISNCVLNLSPNKEQAFREILRVLKPGGELYFSDVFAGRRIPESLQDDPILYGECLAGALYIEDFRRLLQHLGVNDYRVVSKRRLTIDNPAIEEKIGMIDFYSMTVRVFKLPELEDRCEDYGQVAVYSGSMPFAPHEFILDNHHVFPTGKPVLVCGNTALMLQKSRFADYFQVFGDRTTHYGLFDCGHENLSVENNNGQTSGAACC